MRCTIEPSRIYLLCALLLPTGACAPKLRRTDVGTSWYRSKVRCSQGPLDFHVTARGPRWGERIHLVAYSPRDIKGFYEASANGKVLWRGTFGDTKLVFEKPKGQAATPGGTSTRRLRFVAVKRPDNVRCVARPGEAGKVAAVPGPGETGAGGPAKASGEAVAPPRARVVAPPAVAPQRLVQLTAVEGREAEQRWKQERFETMHRFAIGPVWGRAQRIDAGECLTSEARTSQFTPGTKVRIRIWSAQPNDLEGVVFHLEHVALEPSVSDAKWIAHLNRKTACKRRTKERLARHRQRTRRPRVCHSGLVQRGRAGMEYVYYYKRPYSCRDTPKAAHCWGPEGFWRFVQKDLPRRAGEQCSFRLKFYQRGVERRITVKRRCGCAQTPLDATCWGPGGYRVFLAAQITRRLDALDRQREDKLRRARAEALRRVPPPPLPRKEARPPRPSRRAVWVPGYWIWNGARFGWIGGWWRVPKRDVTAGLTTRATRPPPPAPKAERRPPRPVARAVWVPGSWHWSGQAYVWYAGSWRIPPSVQHRWRRARWRRVRGGAIFLPGGWVIRVP